MPSVRQYFYRSVKNVFLIAGSIAALTIAYLAIDWLLPNSMHNGLVIASLYFIKEIGVTILFLIALFFGYRAYRIYKTEKSFPHELLKMLPIIIFWLAIVIFGANFFMGSDSYNCTKHNYNQQLNGGIKEFQGEKYTINICGSGVNNSHFLGDNMDSVQLTVLDAQGQVQVKRNYKVFWDGQPGHEPLTIGPNSITYQDDDKQADYTITMPPTLIEKLKARLPF
ncbi:hypothetical protein BCO71171_05332 [Burkholderia contaminans]|uniref:Uncharacterized protein n=1 Tax=Burkholderia contaminans TaxID=488447 RepID=A0A6P3AUK1_9BURK|nr:hypothetical protein BCO71171_05332 [Burkholderia contaminans]